MTTNADTDEDWRSRAVAAKKKATKNAIARDEETTMLDIVVVAVGKWAAIQNSKSQANSQLLLGLVAR